MVDRTIHYGSYPFSGDEHVGLTTPDLTPDDLGCLQKGLEGIDLGSIPEDGQAVLMGGGRHRRGKKDQDPHKDKPSGSPQDSTPRLWTVRDVARYLARSDRWVWSGLRHPDTEKGSIPHQRLPPGGTPRFDPEEIKEWVRAGCSPVATFRQWHKKITCKGACNVLLYDNI